MDAVQTKTATFTKWMVGEGPLMAGVVGGAAGEGVYAGKVLDYAPGPTTVIAATYRFDGADRPFTALVHVEQTGLDAELSGVVIDGWQKGRCFVAPTTRSTAIMTASRRTVGRERSRSSTKTDVLSMARGGTWGLRLALPLLCQATLADTNELSPNYCTK